MEATAIVKGTKNLEAAKTLVDWSVSEKAMRLYNEGYAVVAISKMSKPVEFLPDDMLKHMIKNDFQWAASNRARILAEWEKRYGAKSEPKK
jgi:iron(III) transport system substrate-binding protein